MEVGGDDLVVGINLTGLNGHGIKQCVWVLGLCVENRIAVFARRGEAVTDGCLAQLGHAMARLVGSRLNNGIGIDGIQIVAVLQRVDILCQLAIEHESILTPHGAIIQHVHTHDVSA